MNQHLRDPAIRTLALFMLAFVMMAAAGVTAVATATAPPWAPLGPYPDQTIGEITDVEVEVTGTKCSSETVDVFGVFSWVSQEPGGEVIPVGSGSGSRAEGCETTTFFNPIPPGVLEAEARRPHTWIITGMETPTDGDREGVPIVWETEPFSLVE